jgi:hypothetical protein
MKFITLMINVKNVSTDRTAEKVLNYQPNGRRSVGRSLK